MFESIAHKDKWASRRLAAGCGRWLAAVAVVSLLSASTARAGVAIYQNVFKGGMVDGYSYYSGNYGERRFECQAYGPWGTPMLAFTITSEQSGSMQTTTLTAAEPPWPIVELDSYYPEFNDYDTRAAWFITKTASTRSKVSVSNTVYRSSAVFQNQRTGQNLAEQSFTFSSAEYDITSLYLCFGHPCGLIVGWVKISIYGDTAWIDESCIATGVYALRVGSTAYDLWPSSPLAGGVRQRDIYVDASAAEGGTGLSWESPFKSLQDGVDAVRLDGTTVHVKPGVYGAVTVDSMKYVNNHEVCAFTIQSTDGPEKTVIEGSGRVGYSSDTRACFWHGDDPPHFYDTIKGFTLRNAKYGVEHGRVENCIVSNCVYGISMASAYNCLIVGNYEYGFSGVELQNCTVTGNGWGVTVPYAHNSIISGNERDEGQSLRSFMYAENCCTNDPRFVNAAAGDYRLRPDSPCIDAGAAGGAVGATDLSGGMRVRGAGVDIGCFEFVPTVSDTNATDGVVVPPEWLEAHYGPDRAASPDAAYQAALLAETANLRNGTALGGRLSAWESYLWDLDPTNSSQYPHAEIEMVDGSPRVKVVPASANRAYSLLGKPTLNAQSWARSPDLADAAFLSTNRFFKVSVEVK